MQPREEDSEEAEAEAETDAEAVQPGTHMQLQKPGQKHPPFKVRFSFSRHD